MVRRGSFIGGQDNLSVPDAPTIGAATAGASQVSVAFTAPSAVGDDPITSFGVSVFPATGTTRTFRVTVASGNLYGGGTGNVFYIDGVSNPALTLVKGFTYVFDQEDSSNSGHPLHFKDTGGSQYSTGVTVTGTAGQSGAKVTLVLAEDATEPSQYYCTSHGNGMGNLITLVAPSASDDPLGQAQYSNTGSSSPITVTGLSNGTSYVAKVWAINDYGNGPLSAATSSFTPALPPLGLFMGGTGSGEDTIDFITITSAGNATDFGDLLNRKERGGGSSSSTRAIYQGGYHTPSGANNPDNVIQYVTMRSAGNATDFGDLTMSPRETGTGSNDVRAITYSGWVSGNVNTNIIDYVTIPTTGNATDFGDSATPRSAITNNINSPTRACFAGGYSESGGNRNTIDYVTIASAGNSSDFGDLAGAAYTLAGLSSNTRGVMAGPTSGESASNTIQYITIASTGNASDFGDLATTLSYGSGVSDSTTGVFHCPQGNSVNVLEEITIASTGNASDFGDLTVARHSTRTGSTAHGGIDATALQAFAPAAMGLYAGGRSAGNIAETFTHYVNIATDGEADSFGDLTAGRWTFAGGAASSTRSVFAAGKLQSGTNTDIMDFFAFSTKGKATDFGDTSAALQNVTTTSNATRGILGGGYTGSAGVNTIEYITIASAGDVTDFGDLTTQRGYVGASSSTTRSVFGGGYHTGNLDTIDYVTIASTGNATDFGDLTAAKWNPMSASSNTRALFAGGNTGSVTNVIEYITIASTGNGTDFGDLRQSTDSASAVSDKTTALFHSVASGGNGTTVDKVTIASTGNATGWGDLVGGQKRQASASNSHGGIS